MNQREKAELLRALHHGPEVLLIGNAWDAVSARVFKNAGFKALGSSSAAIAYTLGYPDGQQISRDEMMAAVRLITRSVDLPVTADVEAGYGPTEADAAETARAVIAAGAVGCNLEDVPGENDDMQMPIDLQVHRIRAMRAVAEQEGVPLVINARTDIYFLAIGPDETRLQRTIERLKAYRDAGADCVFAPGLMDLDEIRQLVDALRCPVNILAGKGCPAISELGAAGVARVSVGSGAIRATLGKLRDVAEELIRHGTYNAMLAGAIPYSEVNRMMAEQFTIA